MGIVAESRENIYCEKIDDRWSLIEERKLTVWSCESLGVLKSNERTSLKKFFVVLNEILCFKWADIMLFTQRNATVKYPSKITFIQRKYVFVSYITFTLILQVL